MSRSQLAVLRVPRSPLASGLCILLRVSRDGLSPLDLKLVATEGLNPYVGTVRQTDSAKLKPKNATGRDDDWESALLAALSGKKKHGTEDSGNSELEVFASVTEGEEMTITIRKNTRGITQRLAVIVLKCDESQEIELFDWAGEAASAASAAEDEKAALAAHSQSQTATIKQLEQRLDELIEARTEHENMLIQKFQALLNSKKLKIRDQQRLLDDKNASITIGKGSRGSRNDSLPREGEGGGARSRKRKAGATGRSLTMSEMSDEDDAASESDGASTYGTGPSTPPRSPDASDQETADDELDDFEAAAPAPSRAKGKVIPPVLATDRQPSPAPAHESPSHGARSDVTPPSGESAAESDDEL